MTKKLKSDEEQKFIETYALPHAVPVPALASSVASTNREVEPERKVQKLNPIYNRTGIFAETMGGEDRITWADVVQPDKLKPEKKQFWQYYV